MQSRAEATDESGTLARFASKGVNLASQGCPGWHILVDLRVHDDPFYKLLYVMEKHRAIYRIFYVAFYVMILHRVDYRMSWSHDLD